MPAFVLASPCLRCAPAVLALCLAACGPGGGSGSSTGTDGGSGGSGGSSAGTSGGSASATSAGSGTSGGSGGTGGTGGTGGSSATATTATTAGSSGGGAGCGPVPCDGASFCDWLLDGCGVEPSEQVSCEPLPGPCPENYAPVCGCDGTVYSNECEAHAAGVDVASAGGCDAPSGMIPCGSGFCDTSFAYCQVTTSDVVGYPDATQCNSFPMSCGGMPSCDCLANEPCGAMCQALDGGFVLTCPFRAARRFWS
jgi:hypothetical protein